MPYRPVTVIEVLLWGRRLGAVARNPASGRFAFQYDPEWVRRGFQVAPLQMPLREQPYEFAGLAEETYRGLPPALADALPDRFGNALIDRWLALEGIDVGDFSVLDRLAYVADRAMGALEFRPPVVHDDRPEPTAVQLADLVLAARRGFDGSAGAVDTEALQQLIRVGSSAGGARAKALVAFNPETQQIRSAWRPLDPGFAHWLIKLDGATPGLDGHAAALGGSSPYGAIEYAYSLMARAAGIEMARTDLLAEGPRHHFLTQRFDRTADGRKLHLISLCGLAHLDFNMIGAHSYDQYLGAARALGLDGDSLAEAFRRMVFNVAAANHDDHTRNFAFLRAEDGPWTLSPAYDVTFAWNPQNRWLRQHLMDVDGKTSGITVADMYAVAERHDVPGYRAIVRTVLDVVAEWPGFADQAGLSATTSAEIQTALHAVRPAR